MITRYLGALAIGAGLLLAGPVLADPAPVDSLRSYENARSAIFEDWRPARRRDAVVQEGAGIGG